MSANRKVILSYWYLRFPANIHDEANFPADWLQMRKPKRCCKGKCMRGECGMRGTGQGSSNASAHARLKFPDIIS